SAETVGCGAESSTIDDPRLRPKSRHGILWNMAGKELNATAAALLGLLHEGSMTGGQLMSEATRRLGPFWTMTRSQVYRELPALAEVGYVRVGKPGPRASVPYTISASGKRAFAKWINESSGIGQLRDPVALRTAFADNMTPS